MRNLKRKLYLCIVVVSAVLICLIGLSVSKSAAKARVNDEAAVREALLKSALSFEKNDLAMASQVWANDESLTVFESGHANYGWADYRDHHLVPEMGEMKNTKYAFSDIRIHLAGKTAWATLKYTISADVPDNEKTRHVDGGGLGTAVLDQRNGRWQILHWHSSAPRTVSGTIAKTITTDKTFGVSVSTKPNENGRNMKTLSVKLAFVLLVAGAALAVSTSGIAQNSNTRAAQERTLIGFISDNHCGLKHMAGHGRRQGLHAYVRQERQIRSRRSRPQTSLPTR